MAKGAKDPIPHNFLSTFKSTIKKCSINITTKSTFFIQYPPSQFCSTYYIFLYHGCIFFSLRNGKSFACYMKSIFISKLDNTLNEILTFIFLPSYLYCLIQLNKHAIRLQLLSSKSILPSKLVLNT